MANELIDYKIDQVAVQIERLTRAVDKICERVELLEKDLFEKKIHKKLVSFLFTLYPFVMVALVFCNDLDSNKITQVFTDTQHILNHIHQYSEHLG